MEFTRRSPVEWQVKSSSGRFAFYSMRYMVPVEKVRNPFAGRRTWTLKVGRIKVDWH